MEISRWRQPPDRGKISIRPGMGVGIQPRRPLHRPSGASALGGRFRWLTPPANFRCPSGTTDFPAPLLITPAILHRAGAPVFFSNRPGATFSPETKFFWKKARLARLRIKGRGLLGGTFEIDR